MTKSIEISNIDRKKLGSQLHYGSRRAIMRRLKKRGVKVSESAIRYAYKPEHPLTDTMREIIKETVDYLEDLRQDGIVQVHQDIADALSDAPANGKRETANSSEY